MLVYQRLVRRLRRAMSGEGGIRTPDTVARMPHFECGAFNHSATSPGAHSGSMIFSENRKTTFRDHAPGLRAVCRTGSAVTPVRARSVAGIHLSPPRGERSARIE